MLSFKMPLPFGAACGFGPLTVTRPPVSVAIEATSRMMINARTV